MTDITQGKGSIYSSTFISRIITLIAFFKLSILRVETVFPHGNELKEALSKFDETARKPASEDESIPHKEELNDGSVRLTMKRFHKDALEFAIKGFSFNNYLEFSYKNILQNIFTEFDNYLVSFSSYLLQERLELLSDITLPVVNIRDMKTDEILETHISKQIHDKFYEGYKELLTGFIKNKLCINYNISNDTITELLELKLIRDIYTHGDGEVNQIFLKKTKIKNIKLGEKIPLTLELINRAFSVTQAIVKQLDLQLIKKYPETVDPKFNIISFLQANDEIATLFSRDDSIKGIRDM